MARTAARVNHQPRGMVLIFVVVILVLLAVMVTTYLATVRLNAAPLAARIGGPASAGQSSFGLDDTSTLDTQLTNLQNAVKTQLLNELFNGSRSAATFRMPGAGYEPWDGYHVNGVTPSTNRGMLLASSVPVDDSGKPRWQHISLSLASAPGYAGLFTDPRSMTSGPIVYSNTDVLNGVEPTALTAQYVYPGGVPQNRTRVYPALITNAGTRIAADADGDGIADSGLFYLTGPASPAVGDVVYYGAVRVVDNAAKVNLNTAWRAGEDITIGGANVANNGYFLSNIGLYELLRPNSPNAPGWFNTNFAELQNLQDTRMGNGGTGMSPLSMVYQDDGAARSDFAFTTWAEAFDTQLGRRLDNPGRYYNNTPFRALMGDAVSALGFRSTLVDRSIAPTTAELTLASSLYKSAANYAEDSSGVAYLDRIFDFYPAGDFSPTGNPSIPAAQWFNDNYHTGTVLDGSSFAPTARAYLTAYNPVSNATSRHYWSGTALPTGMDGYVGTATPRASVNTDDFKPLWRAYWNVMCDDDVAVAQQPTNAHMFDSPLRGGTPLTPKQVQVLRAALAAVNTLDLRDADYDVTSAQVTLPADGASPERTAMVYGQEWHPWVSEVVIDRLDDGTTSADYIAIELYNPYPVALNLNNLTLASFNRTTGVLTNLPVTPALGGGDTIPAGGYFVLHTAASKPADITIAGASRNVPSLAVGQEVVILKPRNASGTKSLGNMNGGAFNENNLIDMVPVDQVILNARTLDHSPPLQVDWETHIRMHYQRGTDDDQWQFVYPGKLNPGSTPAMAFDPNIESDKLGGSFTPGSLGADNTATEYPGTDPFRTIQVSAEGMPGANPYAGSGNRFPFGGFARNGDILDVPYFGSYRISDGGRVTELTSASFDLPYMVTTNAPDENIGRFTPDPTATNDGYQWAAKLFDYLTVHAPHKDYLPDVEPVKYMVAGGTQPQPVPNLPGGDIATANTANENLVPSQGLVNINTAPWEVIAMLPMANDANDNQTLAQDIVTYREANGPFKNLFELNKVPNFQAASGGAPTGPGNDFQSMYYTINRISNLATVRSDTFTCYVLVQAWQRQNDTGGWPRLVGERRAAFVVDRSVITQSKNTLADLKVIDIPVK